MRKLGKYEVLGELGHGAMGVVYRARDPVINRLVALKTITTGLAGDPNLLQRFYREAQSAGGLQHPNIVTIYDMGDEQSLPYIAMELIEGESLEQIIARRTNLPVALKLTYALQACRAFDYAHKRGIIHRDIKPANVMVNKEHVVKVVDFGIARMLDTTKTQTGMLIGTFAYMSPEQYHGEHADERSDIWSFGVLLYELLCFERPFTEKDPPSLMHSICHQDPRPLRELASDCPQELEMIVSKILQKSPEDRCQSMEDLLLELDPIYKELQAPFVAELIHQSSQLINQGELTQARELLVQSLNVDSANSLARTLLDKVTAEQKRITARPRAQQHVNKGRTLLQEGKVQEARVEVENALQLDSSFGSAQELQKQVQREIDRAQSVAEWLQVSRQRLAEGRPDEAEALLAKVLEIEPANEQAKDLRQQALAEKAERQRRLRLLEKMQEARGLWTQQNYEGCIALLAALQKEFSDEEEIQRLLDTVREDEAEQYRQKSLEGVRALRVAKHYPECQAVLLDLQKRFPNDDEIFKLLEDVWLDEAKQRRLQGLEEARSLLASRHYRESIALLTSLEKELPDDEEVSRLLKTAREDQAEQKRQQGIAEARNLLSARRYDECDALLAKLQEQFPNDDEIPQLLDAVREDRAEQRKLVSLAKARSLLAARRYEESIALLLELGSKFRDDDDISRLLVTAREGQADQRKLKGLAEAQSLLAARHYENAISLLTQLKHEFPNEREIPRLLASASEEEAEHQRQHTLAEARALVAAQRFSDALALLETLRATHPKDVAVQKLRALVECESDKQTRFERLQRELETLKVLISEKNYSEILSRAEDLHAEFPGAADLLRLVDFARSQQAQVEREARLRRMIDEVKIHSAAGRFAEAIHAAQVGLGAFPGNSELVRLYERAEIEQKKQRTRGLIEQRIREIKFKINREKFSEAVNLAKETLASAGPDTDVTQLLNSAQVELNAREKKREQERKLAAIRTLVVSGNLDDAARTLNDAIETKILDTFDPRIQRVSQEIEDAKSSVTATSGPDSPSIPHNFTKEYAFFQGPALENAPAPSEAAPATETSTQNGEAVHPMLPPQTAAPPAQFDVVIGPPPQRQTSQPLGNEPAGVAIPTPVAPGQGTEAQPRSRTGASSPVLAESQPMQVPKRRRRVVVTAAAFALVVAAVGVGRHFSPQSRRDTGVVPPAQSPLQPAGPKSDAIEVKQRDAIDAADKLVAGKQLDAALETLREAVLLNGPLTSEVQKKIAQIEESLRDAKLRELRQREEVLWQQAMDRAASGHYREAQTKLRQILELPDGGVLKDKARDYLDRTIPQLERQDASLAQARRSLSQGDFGSAREAAIEIRRNGGDPKPLIDQINQTEGDHLSQFESQFNQLKQRDDETAIQQLNALQPRFQALSADDWSRSGEAQSYVSAIPGAVGEVQARIQNKNAESAFQQIMKRYEQALNGSDKNELTRARSELQPIADGSGPHAREARVYADNLNNAIAALTPTAQPVQPPSPAKPNRAENEAAIRTTIQQYEQAFERRSVESLRKVWPTLGDRESRKLDDTFKDVGSFHYQVQIGSIQINAGGATATVTGSFSQDATTKGGDKRHVSDKIFFQLEKKGGVWLITEVH